MRKATRPLIVLFVVMILVIVPSMSMAAAGAAAGGAAAAAASGATIFGVSLPIAILGGVVIAGAGIYLVTQVFGPAAHTPLHPAKKK